MPYDFTDPRDQERFRVEAISRGADRKSADSYIAKRKKETIELLGQQVDVLESQKKISELTGGTQKDLSKLTEFEKKIVNAQLAGRKALSILEKGEEVSGPISTRIGQIGDLIGRPSKGTEYRSAINLAAAQLFNALAGSAQSEGELKRLEKLMPKDSEQEETAKNKLNTLLSMLNDQATLYGIDIPETNRLTSPSSVITGEKIQNPSEVITDVKTLRPKDMIEPNVNMSGGIAEVGDLVRDPQTGKLKIHGSLKDDPLFKMDKSLGFRVDNSLVRFLANSEFLPIVGGIAGSLIGGIPGGAAGAGASKAIQQGLSELIDPDKQDLSSAGRAILTEAVTDAVLSGLTLGIGKVGSKALGLVLTEPGTAAAKGTLKIGGEAAEEAAQATTKELAESGGKKLPIFGSQEELIKKAYPLSLKEKSAFKERYGTSIANKWIEFLGEDVTKLVDPSTTVKLATEGQEQAGKEISEKIAGRAVKADKVIPKIEDLITSVQKETISETGEINKIVPREFGSAVDDLTEKLGILRAEAAQSNGFISLETLQDMKISLNKAFKGEMVAQSSKELLASGRNTLMTTIEKYGGEGIKDSNLKYYVFDLLKDSAIKADEKVVSAAFDAMDIISVGSGTAMSGGNLAVGAASLAISKLLRSVGKDPLTQLRIVNKLGQYSAEKGNKNALRAIILAAQKSGLPMGIDEVLLKTSMRGATEMMREPQEQTPSDFIQPPNQATNEEMFLTQ